MLLVVDFFCRLFGVLQLIISNQPTTRKQATFLLLSSGLTRFDNETIYTLNQYRVLRFFFFIHTESGQASFQRPASDESKWLGESAKVDIYDEPMFFRVPSSVGLLPISLLPIHRFPPVFTIRINYWILSFSSKCNPNIQ